MPRSTGGKETWRRLLEWDRGQAASERLAGHLLRMEGFAGIDPSHPLGGPDGLKDVLCSWNGESWIGAAFFPRGQQTERVIRDKLLDDAAGVTKNGAVGLAFLTNQEITLADRAAFAEACGSAKLELFHLERVASLLDSPPCYGIRLEFLDIDMTKEEQVAFFSQITELRQTLEEVLRQFGDGRLAGKVPTAELERFEKTLHALVGAPNSWVLNSPVDRLRPPLRELSEYESRLTSLVGSDFIVSGKIDRLRPPLRELQEYDSLLTTLVGSAFIASGRIDRLRPPIGELRKYEELLDSVLEKARRLATLRGQDG